MVIALLTFMLIVPYVVLMVVGHKWPSLKVDAYVRAKVGVSAFFLTAAMGHFCKTSELADYIPLSWSFADQIVLVVGVIEVLGAIGIWIPKISKMVGGLLVLILIIFFPMAILATLHLPYYLLVLIPFHLFAIWWVYAAMEFNWTGTRR